MMAASVAQQGRGGYLKVTLEEKGFYVAGPFLEMVPGDME